MTDFSALGGNRLFDIVLGNVEGFELISIPGESVEVGDAFQNLTPTGGLQEFPTSAETWEILSTDANDALAGTGAQTVAIVSLDDNYVERVTTVSLDGITPVILANTHFRTRDATVLTAGSDTSNTNIGDLIIRVSGGGTERMRIPSGVGDCKSLIYTVPLGKTIFAQNFVFFCAKNRDGTIKPRVTAFGGATIESAQISTYQNGQSTPITAPIRLEEKTDIMIDCRSDNEKTRALVFFDALIVNNENLL